MALSFATAPYENDEERLRRFSEFLRQCRLGVPVEARSIGNFVRLPSRIGKIVSQEEFAEAIGISRCWYGMLEAGRPVRPSAALIDRICDALTLNEHNRLQLVELALPLFSQLLTKTILARRSRVA
jgi:DNA-binding XRE family transcriptional regulator